jgi:hypothetical protein
LTRRRGKRQAWMDNLRVVIIAGVIVAHTATAYILDFPWYYEERTASAVPRSPARARRASPAIACSASGSHWRSSCSSSTR